MGELRGEPESGKYLVPSESTCRLLARSFLVKSTPGAVAL
jgi:hypothetical protein